MILVDTSVWVDHFRTGESQFIHFLERDLVLSHPFVIGELALGSLRQRDVVLDLLNGLHQAPVVTHAEVIHFISQEKIHSRGIGYVDVHLLASTLLAGSARLWTRDKRLQQIADEMDIGLS